MSAEPEWYQRLRYPLRYESIVVAHARNYDLLNVMMDDSFMIGYWLSEGTIVAPAEAIEQLQRNLLNSVWGLGVWNFLGVWDLEFEIFHRHQFKLLAGALVAFARVHDPAARDQALQVSPKTHTRR